MQSAPPQGTISRGPLTQYQHLRELPMDCHDHNLRDIWAKDLLNVGGDEGEGGHMEGVLDRPLTQHQNLCQLPMQRHDCDLQNVWAEDLLDIRGYDRGGGHVEVMLNGVGGRGGDDLVEGFVG